MLLSSSGTRASTSTWISSPVPLHAGQAPKELNANDSAPGWVNRTPHTGQVISSP